MSFEYFTLTDLEKSLYSDQLQGWSTGWYIDKSRDISIWGGVAARHWQEMAEGKYNHHFRLRLGNKVFHFILKPGYGSISFSDVPYVIVWDSVFSYSPSDMYGYDYDEIIEILKEALSAWGGGYSDNTKWHPNFVVKCNF